MIYTKNSYRISILISIIAYYYGDPGFGARVPAGLNLARGYDFQVVTAIEYQRLMQQGYIYANDLRSSSGEYSSSYIATAPVVPVAAAPPRIPTRTLRRDDIIFAEDQILLLRGIYLPQIIYIIDLIGIYR